MEVGLVQKVDIDSEMQQAYLDYAMSVIVARALPDARDGLKPVHRRILYAMHDMGIRASSGYKKSARIVGEVLGKYHPHGDMAVYDAMARMAQDFSMRYLLVDGQGNFGSIDGDAPAAMRYTEARLNPLSEQILADIQRNTVDFSDNFDGTLKEPDVLPAAFPNLLVNGATGIAVGMATSIPPHNLGEVTDALIYLLERWEKMDDVTVEDLMHFVHGPDFPTGGVIIQDTQGDALTSAYASGRGRVTVQARAHLEEMSRGRNRIIVTELPYMTNKSSLIERIAELARDGKLEGIADLRDESDRQGMRIVIEMSKTAEPEAVLRELYRITPMRSTFSLIMLALVDGEPRMLSLKQALRVYLEHRLTVVKRRSEFDLERARARAHILEGLRIALQHLDEVIALIRKAPDADAARLRLIKRFKLSDLQAQAILDMPLRRLAALERKKIEEEFKEVQAQIKALEALLRSPKKMRQLVAEELLAVKQTFGDARRTQIVRMGEGESHASLLTTTDLVPEQFVWVMATPEGLIARTADDKPPRRSGREAAARLVRANTRDTLYLVAENGEAAAVPMHVLPVAEKAGEGAPFNKVSPLTAGHKLAAVFALPGREERPESWFVLTVTSQGMVKKSPLSELPGPSAQPFILAKVNGSRVKDRLGWLHLTDGREELLLVSANGMAIRFKEEEVRPMGLVAGGVMGIKLGEGDELVGAELSPKRGEVLLVASDGSAKRMPASQFPIQGRYGQGVIAWKLPKGIKVAGMAAGKGTTPVAIILADHNVHSVQLDQAVQQGRALRGKALVDLKKGGQVVGLSVPWNPPRPGEKVPEEPAVEISTNGRSRKTSASASKAKTGTAQPRSKATRTAPKPKRTTPTAKQMAMPLEAESKADSDSKAKKPAPKPPAKTTPSGSKKPASASKPKANPSGSKPKTTDSRNGLKKKPSAPEPK